MRTNHRAVLAGIAVQPFDDYTLRAQETRDITWKDLIPPDASYFEIVGDGEYNGSLNGTGIKMPGYMLLLENSAARITEFNLTPCVGACTYMPLLNQQISATTNTLWSAEMMWDAILATRLLNVKRIRPDLTKIG